MRTTVSCILIGLASASLLASAPSHAQWSPSATVDMGMNYGQMALSQSAMGGTRALSKSSSKAIRETAAPVSRAPQVKKAPFNPRFKSDPQVSRLVDQRFANYLASDEPDVDAAIAVVLRDLATGRYRAEFRKMLTANGLAANDLVDVTATHYAALWELLHGKTLTTSQVISIRDQLRQTLRDEPTLGTMDDADRQEIAETFMLHTVVVMDGYRTIQSSGDSALLARYRAGVQRNMLPDGPDLKSLGVGSGGFTSGAQALR